MLKKYLIVVLVGMLGTLNAMDMNFPVFLEVACVEPVIDAATTPIPQHLIVVLDEANLEEPLYNTANSNHAEIDNVQETPPVTPLFLEKLNAKNQKILEEMEAEPKKFCLRGPRVFHASAEAYEFNTSHFSAEILHDTGAPSSFSWYRRKDTEIIPSITDLTLLVEAAQEGDEEYLRDQIAHGVALNVRSPHSRKTLVHFAAESDKPEVIALVLEQHPELLTAEDCTGDTPLKAAVSHKCTDCIELLTKLDSLQRIS